MRRAPAMLLLGLLRCGEENPFPRGEDLACAVLAPGVRCAPTEILRCGDRGNVIARLPACASGERCFDGYGCGMCAPGAVDCGDDGETPRTCESDHRWLAQPRCDASQVCERGRCVLGCDPDPAARETRGCEFWATQTLHRTLPRETRDGTPFTVLTANPWRRAVQYGAEGPGIASSVRVVAALGLFSVDQPWNPALVDGGDPAAPHSVLARRAAVRLRTGLRVAAWQYSPLAARRSPCEGAGCETATGDASTLLPVTALGRFYVVGALPTARNRASDGAWRAHPAFVTVVGTSAGTQLTVIARGATEPSVDGMIPAMRRGDRQAFTLGEGDVLQLLSASSPGCTAAPGTAADGATVCPPSPDEDLSGTRLEATAPVAVFVGHDCARVPWNGGPCARREEQLPPLLSLGPRYVLAPDPGATARWRVIAPYDDTRLDVTPASVLSPRTLMAGEVTELESSAPVELRASRPVLVLSLSAGLSVEAPTAQWRGVSEVHAPFGFTTEVDLAATLGTGVVIDGNLLTLAADTRLPGAVTWRVALAPGLHRITSDSAMGVLGVRVRASSLTRAFSLRGGSDLRDLPVPD